MSFVVSKSGGQEPMTNLGLLLCSYIYSHIFGASTVRSVGVWCCISKSSSNKLDKMDEMCWLIEPPRRLHGRWLHSRGRNFQLASRPGAHLSHTPLWQSYCMHLACTHSTKNTLALTLLWHPGEVVHLVHPALVYSWVSRMRWCHISICMWQLQATIRHW